MNTYIVNWHVECLFAVITRRVENIIIALASRACLFTAHNNFPSNAHISLQTIQYPDDEGKTRLLTVDLQSRLENDGYAAKDHSLYCG